jgi:hypothetical protein
MAAAHNSAVSAEAGPVQVLTGRIDADEVVIYRLSDLKQGQVLTILVEATSGNLDPAVGVMSGAIDEKQLEALYEEGDEAAARQGGDPVAAMEALRKKYFLGFDDDGGGGLTPALRFEIPADGEYGVLVAGSQRASGRETFGNYRLMLGINREDVLDGIAVSIGPPIATRNLEATPPGVGVHEVRGRLDSGRTSAVLALEPMKEGDTLYAWMKADGEMPAPDLQLNNFAGKPIKAANLDGKATQTALQHTFQADAENYHLEISASGSEGNIAEVSYRLLVGINVPAVLTGQAELDGRPVIRMPIEVRTGLRLEQIIQVNQAKELFSAVATLRMQWRDPALAFNPEQCQCDSKILHDLALDRFIVEAAGKWPAIVFRNQQGKRWSQSRIATIGADGSVVYTERFTTNFQVDFDFRRFPFDTQTFLIHLDAVQPEEYVVLRDLEEFSDISKDHGEDEFILTSFDTRVSSTVDKSGESFSSFTFSFEAPRHLNYYVFRIFVPIALITLVSWFTFFLRDYKQRIEMTSGNLLVFIAFSFSIAGNYPRLGYLTLLDAVMVVVFVGSALVIVYNVSMKRLEASGQETLVNRIDNIMDWSYPLLYVAMLGILIHAFF